MHLCVLYLFSWYRCKIMDMDDGRYDLLYMDTGEREWVAKDDVRPMPSKFANWPFQAIECSLAYISPTSGTCWVQLNCKFILLHLA